MEALTEASFGLPKESLGSAQGCVDPLVRGPVAFAGNYRVPLSSLSGHMGEVGTFLISWMPLLGFASGCPKSPGAVPRGVWAHWLRAPGRSQGTPGFPLVHYGSYGRRGYIPDLLDVLTGASWGLPKESLGSAQGCVGSLVRGPGAFPGNYRVPLSSLWGPMGEGGTFQISWMPLQGLAGA